MPVHVYICVKGSYADTHLEEAYAFLQSHPLQHKGRAFICHMKESDPWVSASTVTKGEILKLLRFIDRIKDPEMKANVYIKINSKI